MATIYRPDSADGVTMNACSVFKSVCIPLTKDYTHKDPYPDTLIWEVSVDKEALILHRGERVSLEEALSLSADNPEAMKSLAKFQSAKREFEQHWIPLLRRGFR